MEYLEEFLSVFNDRQYLDSNEIPKDEIYLYKLGFVGPRHMGNSYKMLNHKVNKFFKNEYINS